MPTLLWGMLVNVQLLLALIALGLVTGVFVALIEVYAPHPLAALALAYEWFFRGVPELVLLFLFYFGLTQMGINIGPFFAAVLALGFRSSGYQSQIFRGAIQSIPPGQMMAAHSLGMGSLKAIRHVVLPQALRLSIPPWSNEFSAVFKDTTLAYGIGVVEIVRQARYMSVRNFPLTLPVFIAVALLFLVLTYLGNWGLGKLEQRLRVPGLEARAEREEARAL
ncbi:MAG: amino acid ABC transporter permease [Candidatus Bipolaricaulota bacterium]